MVEPDRPTILIVDDRAENRLALQAALARPDYDLQLASSGEEALSVLLRQDCAVILMDAAMPGLDGFETVRLIRQRQRTRNIPVIFVTATMSDVRHGLAAYHAGAVDYLVKPLDMDVLRAKVGVFVQLWQQARAIERASAALREAEQRERAFLEASYDVTFEHAPIGIGHASLDGRWLRVNACLADILGRPASDVLSLSIEQTVEAGDRATLAGRMRDVAEGRIGQHKGEYRLLAPRRDMVWAAVTVSIIRGRDGAPLYLVLVEDVTTERKLALALEASERRFARMREADLIGVFSQDAEGVVHDANDAFLRIGGFTREDLAERLVTSPRSSDPGSDADLCAQEQLVRTGVCHAREMDLVKKDGGSARVLVGAVADDHGLTGFALDVTALREAERERARALHDLEETVRARDDFLYLAAHELRNPLTPLVMQMATLREHAASAREPIAPEWLARQLAPAERAASRLARLVDELLDVSRAIVSPLVLEREATDLAQLARDVGERMRPEIERARSTLSLHGQGPVIGTWDRARLTQMIEHLLSNAVKYGAGKPIDMGVLVDPDRARFYVLDRGIGIRHEDRARIFGRFERLLSIRNYGGFGLGLWLVRQIVEAHGGTIDVWSEPGQGSRFTVELPREVPEGGGADA